MRLIRFQWCDRRSERGFATLPALMLLLLLATVAAAAATYLSSSVASFAVYNDRLRAQALIHAGIELVAYDLLSGRKDERKAKGSLSFKLDNGSVTVDYVMEDSRIDLNVAPKRVLANLFEVLGAGPDQAAACAERIVGWRTPLNKQPALDQETAIYRDANLAYGPKGASFSSEDELWLIPGLPPALVERALKFVTVYSGRREIDVFGAAPEVIAALPGVQPQQITMFLAQREVMPKTPAAVIDLLGAGGGMAAAYSQDSVRLNCSVVLGDGTQASAEIVIQLQGGTEPYQILSWREAEQGLPDPVPN